MKKQILIESSDVMRWKEGTFEKIETNDASVAQLVNTFKEQNLNGGAIISCFKVHNENFSKKYHIRKRGMNTSLEEYLTL